MSVRIVVGYMSPLEQLTGACCPHNGDGTRNEIWGARQGERHVAVEPQCLDNSREEVLEIARRHVQVLHKHQHPEVRVPQSFEEAGPRARVVLETDRVFGDAGIR